MNSSHSLPSESHTTLVEKDMGPNAKSQDTLDYNPTHNPKKLWVDRILGLFCAKTSIHNEKTKALETPEVGGSLSTWPSPWILPVYVMSNQQDADKHSIEKIAKCTIDTGNMQGNIVSRDFVENVLGFPSSSFGKLTKEEATGGTGITGEPHIPFGVINLTWYHKSSTRVFRDMRFLVSPAQNCDLIIGAWSIQKDKILDVPCLTVTRPSSIIFPNWPRHKDEDLDDLKRIDGNVRHDWDESRNDRDEHDEGTTQYNKLEKIYQEMSNEVDVVGWLIQIRAIAIAIRKEEEPDTSEVAEIWTEIGIRWDDVRPEIQVELDPRYQKLLKVKVLGLVDNRAPFKI